MGKKQIELFKKYKPLMKQLVIKDIKLKYRRSFLGYIWSILNPLMIMIIMVIVFRQMFRFNIENYPVYLLLVLHCLVLCQMQPVRACGQL